MTTSVTEIPGYVTGTWDIDPVHSHIGFEARHMFVSKVRGHFETFEGQIITAPDPLQSSATLTVQMQIVIAGLVAGGDRVPGSRCPARSAGWTSASARLCRTGAAWPATRSG